MFLCALRDSVAVGTKLHVKGTQWGRRAATILLKSAAGLFPKLTSCTLLHPGGCDWFGVMALPLIPGARYHALLIPDCPGAMVDLANNGYLARILQHFSSENKPICAVGHGAAALCCATNEDKSWVFQEYSLTGPCVYELIRLPSFASLPIIFEDFAKDSGAIYSASKADAVHVVLDRHLVTGQNENSTVAAVQNLVFLCNGSRK
ncbi:glutamine amidotransferase-like class 1 domain-containing protein 1 isoform X3 [Zootoca vivipara]|uniref:glutamine amidotransferase-like class 1 domain-containing protein 1 isoform X3 n=1 Tax=Zootoca vivipara TaxID=8524 RepID=UPI00293BC5D1|nr:glutamine amidotransferase-like class 1 domain-containing protein 1 isoform X3 [Zootoca vivipara]